MSEITEVLNARLATPENLVRIANLATVVTAHEVQGFEFTTWDREETACNVTVSSQTSSRSVIINRSIDTILAPYKLDIGLLQDFAKDKRVVDHGPGRSNFLNHFGKSTTLAIDAREEHAQYQADQGHEAIVAEDLSKAVIENDSVALLNASWSLPFWSKSPEAAKQAFTEFFRILAVGGIALIGPISRKDIHTDWENMIFAKQAKPDKHICPWSDGDNALLSATFAAFCAEMLKFNYQGTLSDGFAEVITARHVPDTLSAWRELLPAPLQVPNYVILRKLK